MSLLLSAGHADATRYPIAVVWSEARIVRQRNASRTKVEAVTMQAVIASILSKQGGKLLKETLARMDEHD